jgi:archaellum biogenesis ATPase FlaH
MLDLDVLSSAIADRKSYEQIKPHVKDKDFSPHVGYWFKQVRDYYERDRDAQRVNLSVLRDIGLSENRNPKQAEALGAVLGGIVVGGSNPNVIESVLSLRRYNLAAEFAAASMGGDSKKAKKLLAELNDVWATTTLDKFEYEYAGAAVDVLAETGTENRIPVFPTALTERIGGGVLPGHHILVFGRTEMGKSLFAINTAWGFVRKNKRVLYIGNEERVQLIKKRFIVRANKASEQWVDQNRDVAVAKFVEAGGESLLTCVHMASGGVQGIRRLAEENSPEVIVLDQIRNLEGAEDGLTQRLEHNASLFRSFISEHGIIGLSVTQAGDKSDRHNQDPPIWLGTGDVDSSRVGLPGTTDLMLGISANTELRDRGQRAISIC